MADVSGVRLGYREANSRLCRAREWGNRSICISVPREACTVRVPPAYKSLRYRSEKVPGTVCTA